METYTFPIIETIDEIKALIKDKKDFVCMEKEHYDVIDYVFQQEGTFDHPLLRECRGIMFDKKGNILARKFHKFFNVNEIPETSIDSLDFTDCSVLEKLDGSMLSAYYVNGMLEFGTKAGRTDVSIRAEKFLNENQQYKLFCHVMVGSGQTPIFEWLDPENPIVIRYSEPNLVLTAVRNNYSGHYKSYKEMEILAEKFNIPLVKRVDIDSSSPVEIIEAIRKWQDAEGVVIRHNKTGHMVKIKADDYVKIHKIKEQITMSHHQMRLILEDSVDDVIGVLPDYEAVKLKKAVSNLRRQLTNFFDFVYKEGTYAVENIDRKEFGKIGSKKYDALIVALIFNMYNGQKIDIEHLKIRLKMELSDRYLKSFVKLLKNDFDF